jgi:hypothetical protein
MGAVGIQRHRQAPGPQHVAQGRHDGGGALAAVAELGIEDVLGGVIHDGDEREVLLGDQREPAGAAAVEMEQLPEARAGLAPAAVAAPGAVLGHEAGHLPRLLDEGVAERHAVLSVGAAPEVADIEAGIAIAVEAQQPLDLGNRGPFGRRRPPAPIEQLLHAIALELPPQPAHAPGAPAENVRRLQPGELPTERSQDDLLDLHGTLHGADGVAHGHLLGDQFCPSAPVERSFHGALGRGQITYPRHRPCGRLDSTRGAAYRARRHEGGGS